MNDRMRMAMNTSVNESAKDEVVSSQWANGRSDWRAGRSTAPGVEPRLQSYRATSNSVSRHMPRKEGTMPAHKNLDDLFFHTLRRVLDAERRLTSVLPKMAKAAEAAELRQAFESHLKETKTHVERLEQLFAMFDRRPNAETDDALKGIVKAGDEAIKLDASYSVKDAALIAAAQEAEHYEMAAYGTLRTWAQVLAKPEAVRLLERTLDEERRADQTLTAVAGGLNFQAATTASRR
jgi:ferritin-like metal-binding protein YciE